MPPSETSKDIAGFEYEDDFNTNIQKGKNYLLAIGINDYINVPELFNAVKDVKDIVALLQDKFDFLSTNTIELYNEEATKKNIYKKIRELQLNVTSSDNLVIYFSGHGEFDKIDDEGFWIPVEAEKGAADDYIPNSVIRKKISTIKAHHIFLIVDSCFSGAFFQDQVLSKNISLRKERDASRWGLTAGRNEIVIDGDKGKNSPFAESILYQLNNATKSIGVAELCFKVLEVVAANETQTPRGEALKMAGHKGGQFVFHLKKDEGADWKDTITKDTIEAYQLFIKKHPTGQFKSKANSKIKEIESSKLWEKILAAPYDNLGELKSRLQLVEDYLDDYESEQHYADAVNQGRLLKYKRDFLWAKNDEYELRNFLLKRCPDIDEAKGIRNQAQQKLDKIKVAEKEKEDALQKAHEERKAQKKIEAEAKKEKIEKNTKSKEKSKPTSNLAKLLEESRKKNEAQRDKQTSKETSDKPDFKFPNSPTTWQDQHIGLPPQPNVFLEFIKNNWALAASFTVMVILGVIGGVVDMFKESPNQAVAEEQAMDNPIDKEKVATIPIEESQSGTFIDERDGQEYNWVRMKDGKKWMAENLNYEMEGSYCYDDDGKNCEEYGRLYTWEAAMKVCPEGWRLPSDDDWWNMTEKYGKVYNWDGRSKNIDSDGGKAVYKALMPKGGTGFFAQFGGYRYSDGRYSFIEACGRYWSSTERDAGRVWHYYFSRTYQYLYRAHFHSSVARSCRCIQD